MSRTRLTCLLILERSLREKGRKCWSCAVRSRVLFACSCLLRVEKAHGISWPSQWMFACLSPRQFHPYITIWFTLPGSRTRLCSTTSTMLRRPHSTTPPASPRISKKAKLDHLSPDSFKNGVFLAPMVRSGACTSSCTLFFDGS